MSLKFSSLMTLSCTVRVSNIPYAMVAEELMEFLESSIGAGTVFAIKIHTERCNWKSKGFGYVQFETEAAAIKAVELSRKCKLRFQQKALKVDYEQTHIIDRPQLSFCGSALHIGWVAAENEFSSLWSWKTLVTIELYCRKQKLILIFEDTDTAASYKLSWTLSSLHIGGTRSRTQQSSGNVMDPGTQNETKKSRGGILLLQAKHAPKIHKKVKIVSSLRRKKEFSDGRFSFLRDKLEEQNHLWQRCTDFTKNNCIALASSYCLEIPMAEGVIYDVFVETLLNDDAFNEFTDIYIKPEVSTSHGQHNRSDHLIPTELNEGLIRINRLIITPTKEYFIGPEVEVSNRVTRKFKDVLDNFLRVQFTDEDMSALSARTLETSPETFLKTQIRSERTDIYHRIHDVLKHGIRLDGKNYEFLAFSSSQLRSHSLWMFASDQNLNSTCDSIRSWMGNFANIRNVAKCAARMGQCFSSSKQGPVICHYEIEEIPDIERMNAGVNYCFSDGIGRISPAFALDVARTCACFKGKRHNALTPSAFQIRYGGYKGVVAIYPSSISKVTFRPSMKKFQSELNVLDVLEWTRFLPCYLNRQIITLLSTLGLSDDVFISMQKERFISLDGVLKNREAAVKLLQVSCGGEHHKMMMQMLFAGYDPGEEPFLLSMLQAFKSAQIQQILKKSKIFVPKGRILMGCLDEYACLNYGEVFVKVSSSEGSPVHVIKGTVIVTKNPCLHPGDIRILQAVDSPDLQHMIDCVVFPQKGARPHPNECSGSDLDGDLYFVSWDERLIPPVMEPPMDYYPPNSIALDHFPTLEEIQDYFMEYMSNDSLGTIANAHVVFADKEPEKARSQPCIELAELSSIAVDFPKTGVSAMLPKHLRPKAYPDFMEKSGKRSYISTGILGKLYRAAKEDIAGITTSAHLKLYHEYYDPQLVLDGYEDHVEKALQYRRVYDEKLTAMMQFYGVQSEAEMLTGCFSELRPTFGNSIKDVEEKILHAFSGLVVDAKSWFKEMHVAAGQNKDYVIASAWYHVTYHRDFLKQEQGPELGKTWLVSFAWLNYDKLLEIKKYRRLDKSLSAMESLK